MGHTERKQVQEFAAGSVGELRQQIREWRKKSYVKNPKLMAEPELDASGRCSVMIAYTHVSRT